MCGVSIIRDFIRRFEEREGISGVIICDLSGVLIETDLDIEIKDDMSEFITSLISKAKQLVNVLKEGGLKFIRLETSKGDIMIALEEQLIIIILRGEKRAKKQGYYDRLPYPYIFNPPYPPDDLALAPRVQLHASPKKKDSELKIHYQYCGMKFTKEEQFTHSCKKKP